MSDVEGERTGKLYLIDGNSLAYRAFFALPDTFIDSKGMPNNALFGLAAMFIKIVAEHEPLATIVAWDAGLSGRGELYEPYKAQRESRPEPLAEQWPFFAPLAEAFGFSNVREAGWEADDVIASLVDLARAAGHEVVVVTGDRDALQLVGEGVTVMATTRGVTDTKEYDAAAVVDRYGIPPELVPDFIGLKGDTSDNIPGVPGIGEKTAGQLLRDYGTLENVLANIEHVSGAKRRENLTEHAEIARLSKQLATAHRDIKLNIDMDAALSRRLDLDHLRAHLREIELREPLRRLEKALVDAGGSGVIGHGSGTRPAIGSGSRAGGDATVGSTGAVRRVDVDALAALADAEVLLVRSAKVAEAPRDTLFAEAAEQALPDRLLFAVIAGAGSIVAGEAASAAAIFAAWGERPVITHDLKESSGRDSAGIPPIAHDTRIAAHLLNGARRDLSLPALAHEAQATATADAAAGEVAPALLDLARDALLVAAITEFQRPLLLAAGLDKAFSEIELPLVGILARMERVGVKVDGERLASIGREFAAEIAELEREIYADAGGEFTIGSPKQLGEVLFERLGLSRKRRGKTGYSTDARVLAAIRDEHEIVGRVERWRELSKLKSTYIAALPAAIDPADGRVHTTFNQTAAATGRLSSTNPNLQSVPVRTSHGERIRACFVCEPGNALISADYSQVELRVLAHVARDEAMREIFRRGDDVHRATAAEVFGVPLEQVDARLRDRAKAINFGIIYGLSAFGLSDRLKIPRDEAAAFIERYLGRFPGVREFIEATIAQAREDGYVATLYGRRRAIPELASSRRQTRQLGERLAVNTVLQGTAADIIKLAMIACDRALTEAQTKTSLVLQIHDELLFEGPAEEAPAVSELVRGAMVNACEIDPPLVVDIGHGADWLAAK